MHKKDTVDDAAKALYEYYNDTHTQTIVVGAGLDKLYVYAHESKKRFSRPIMDEWMGYPIEYHFGVGKPKAH